MSGIPKEGRLYKRLCVAGHWFEMTYGYYEEWERALYPPVVIFPDLSAAPLYSREGHPLVTQIQDPCEHHVSKNGHEKHWCGDCSYFSGEHPEIGICRCEARKLTAEGGT